MDDGYPLGRRLVGIAGIIVLVGMAWFLSSRRRQFPWKMVLSGLGLQVIFALLILRTGPGLTLFKGANEVIKGLLAFTRDGAAFLFGPLARDDGPMGFLFAFQVLPTIIFFASLMSVLYHLGVMQRVVAALAWVMRRSMRISGAESLAVSANVFVGMTEAPLAVRPYVDGMTRSEIMTLMTGGFATIAGGVFAAYVLMGIDGGHLLAASLMSAPAALMVSKILEPETETPSTQGLESVTLERETVNVLDAAARGAADGLRLALNVGAMLLAFVALVALANFLLEKINVAVDEYYLAQVIGTDRRICPDDLEALFGGIFGPLAFLMGVPAADAQQVGNFMGQKIVVNEFIGYMSLTQEMKTGALHPHSILIATYALCGFANFGSIAIQLGGIGGIAPRRREDLARLGLRAMTGGAIASFLTAAIAGIIA